MSITDNLYRRTTTIQMFDGRRVMCLPGGEIVEIGDEKPSEKNFTLYDSSASEKSSEKNFTLYKTGAFDTTGFDKDELKLLREIENAQNFER